MNSQNILRGVAHAFAAIVVGAALTVVLCAGGRGSTQVSQTEMCMNNLRQLGQATMEYAQDYDDKFPDGANGYGIGTGWAGQLYPYVRKAAAFRCPSDATSNPGVSTSYCINRNVDVYNPFGTGPDSVKRSALVCPGRTVLLCEIDNSGYYDITAGNGVSASGLLGDDFGEPAGWAGGSPSGFGLGNQWDLAGFNTNVSGQDPPTNVQYATGYLLNSAGADGNPYFTGPTGRHENGANYLMADGHVQWFLPQNVSGGWPNPTPGDCGSPSPDNVAASVGCPDQRVLATFNIN